jgi:thiosulfate/3-mercaptopyruvate sulfurtransferase
MFSVRANLMRRYHTEAKITTARKFIMETQELNEILRHEEKLKQLRVLDCSWFLPNDPKKARELFKSERIPYSQFFDIDEVADKSTSLAHMIPTEEEFIKHMKAMDIRKNDHIVCYDRAGMFSAPRAWFAFKVFGCPNVYVLNGGFPKWIQENLPRESNEEYKVKKIEREEPCDSDFDYKLDRSKIVDINQVIETSAKITGGRSDHHIVDCRPALRFKGEVDEPRPVKRRGHIDGAVNIFFKDLLGDNSCFKSNEEITAEFEKKNVDLNKPIIFSCGSGCTACTDILAMALIDKYENSKLYDGSWAEFVKYFNLILGKYK